MSKKLLILAAVVSFAVSGAAFAAVENIKVSGDITAQAVSRNLQMGATFRQLDQLGNFDAGVDQEDFLLSQIRLRFDADLTEQASAVVSLINERLWGTETAADTDIALDLGYVEMKEFLYEPLTVIVGRQNLRYGNALIIGDPDTNQTASAQLTGTIAAAATDLSMRKAFDAVRGILDYSPYTIDVIYAKVAENATSLNDDITLYGVNASYLWDSYNGITEAYLFGSSNTPSTLVAAAQDANNDVYVLGTRAQYDPNDNLTLGGELAYQFGDYRLNANSHAHLSAWALQLISEYRLLDDYNTKFGLSYTWLSGDNKDSKGYNGWDPLFEDQAPAEIMNILGANTNAHFIRVTGSYMPQEDITLGAVYCKAFLAQKLPNPNQTAEGAALTYNGVYSPAVGPATGTAYSINNDERDFGDEVDVYGVYDYTEDVQVKLLGGLFVPGGMFTEQNEKAAYALRGTLVVNF